MNEFDLLNLVGEAREDYVLSAIQSRETTYRKNPRRKAWFIAAMISLLLLLVGCVAYVLNLQDFSVGQDAYTQKFNDEGLSIEPAEKNRDVFGFYGKQGDPCHEAAKEWYAFTQLQNQTDVMQGPDIPESYLYTYGCRTKEAADKLEFLAEKYGLTLLDRPITFQQHQAQVFWKHSGIPSLLQDSAPAEILHASVTYYPPYNFTSNFEMVLTDTGRHYHGSLFYLQKNYFPSLGFWHLELDDFTQWHYTTDQGDSLLMAMNQKGRCFIIADRSNTAQVVTINGNLSDSLYPAASDLLEKEQLNAIAECFDFHLAPEIIKPDSIQRELEQADQAFQEAHTFEPEIYANFENYLKEGITSYTERQNYVLYDITGDGSPELLLGEDGYCTHWLTMIDGQVVNQHEFGYRIYFGENGVMSVRPGLHNAVQVFTYHAPIDEQALVQDDHFGQFQFSLRYERGTWAQLEGWQENQIPISEETAIELCTKFIPLELNWQPLFRFPLKDGTTLGEYAESLEKPMSNDALLAIYGQALEDQIPAHGWYLLHDINRDGVQDLLVSEDGNAFQTAFTYRYGTVYRLIIGDTGRGDFYLCEDNILEKGYLLQLSPGEEAEFHNYFRLNGPAIENLDCLCYNKSTASWTADVGGAPLTPQQVQAIMDSHPRILPEMHPVSDLMAHAESTQAG